MKKIKLILVGIISFLVISTSVNAITIGFSVSKFDDNFFNCNEK